MSQLISYARDTAIKAKAASRRLASVHSAQKNAWLRHAADAIRRSANDIKAANKAVLDAAPGLGLTSAAIDRLRLTDARIE
jgi:glutamate-5-semialdehyde dehydrogenase